MGRRPIVRFHPDLDRCEERTLLSAGHRSAHAAAVGRAEVSRVAQPDAVPTNTKGFLAYRITNPQIHTVNLFPPFQQVAVQGVKPVTGQVYNIVYVVVKNGTAQTFTAADGFTARVPGFTGSRRVNFHGFPILTGNQVWKPNQWVVFYYLTKKYYPMSPQAAAGFQLQLDGRSSTLIPGPSGFVAHIKYHPATLAKVINFNVAYGQGAELGPGAAAGIGDTALNIVVSAKTNRQDYAGHF